MTWAIKIRGDSKALIAAEYECPAHGRFEITVPRDEVPDEMPCPHVEDIGSSVKRVNCCGLTSSWCFPSPARTSVQRVTAARRGKDPEPPPGCMDWRAGAYDEVSPDEWHAKEDKRRFEDVHRILKKAVNG